jgi:ribose 5-phosphate isomerase A
VIVSSDKLVDAVHAPVPLEVMRFGLRATLRHLEALGPCRVREGPGSPDGNLIVDFVGDVEGAEDLAAAFDRTPGVVAHGLFPPGLVHDVIAAFPGGEVRRL